MSICSGLRAATFSIEITGVVVDFFEDFLRAHRWFVDPENRTEAFNLIAQYTKIGFAFERLVFGSIREGDRAALGHGADGEGLTPE